MFLMHMEIHLLMVMYYFVLQRFTWEYVDWDVVS